jgi:hypothetical protein
MFNRINKWLSEPVSQVILHRSMVMMREPHVFVRLCLGHSLAIPQAILRPLAPDTESMGGHGSVTLRLSETISPDEAEFLYRLVSVAIQLTTLIQKSSAAKLRMRQSAYQLQVRFHLARQDCRLEGNKYVVRFGSGLIVTVPSSLVNVEEIKQADTNEVRAYQVAFNSASLLAPLLNELVHTISQLVQNFGSLVSQDE